MQKLQIAHNGKVSTANICKPTSVVFTLPLLACRNTFLWFKSDFPMLVEFSLPLVNEVTISLRRPQERRQSIPAIPRARLSESPNDKAFYAKMRTDSKEPCKTYSTA